MAAGGDGAEAPEINPHLNELLHLNDGGEPIEWALLLDGINDLDLLAIGPEDADFAPFPDDDADDEEWDSDDDIDESELIDRNIQYIIAGESNVDAKRAARMVAECVMGQQQGDEPLLDQLCLEHGIPMIRGLLQMLQTETDLFFLDEYTFLLTGLRQKMEGVDGFPARRIANLLILESTPTLLEVFLNGYAKNPQGYTAPELVSMWSSILNQEGVSVCSRYMAGMEHALIDCAKSHTVGSIVAILLIANLNSNTPATIANVAPLFGQVQAAFLAAFSGDEFAERQWGPGPVTKCLSALSIARPVQEQICAGGLLLLLEQVLTRDDHGWPVRGFDSSYYTDARASACKVIWNVAENFDVVAACPAIRPSLEALLPGGSRAAQGVDGGVASVAVTQNAYGALLQIAKFETNTAPDFGLAGSGPAGSVVVLPLHKSEAAAAAALAAELTGCGLASSTIDLERHDLGAIENAGAVVILVPKSTLAITKVVATTVRFVLALRKPCAALVRSTACLDALSATSMSVGSGVVESLRSAPGVDVYIARDPADPLVATVLESERLFVDRPSSVTGVPSMRPPMPAERTAKTIARFLERRGARVPGDDAAVGAALPASEATATPGEAAWRHRLAAILAAEK